MWRFRINDFMKLLFKPTDLMFQPFEPPEKLMHKMWIVRLQIIRTDIRNALTPRADSAI